MATDQYNNYRLNTELNVYAEVERDERIESTRVRSGTHYISEHVVETPVA